MHNSPSVSKHTPTSHMQILCMTFAFPSLPVRRQDNSGAEVFLQANRSVSVLLSPEHKEGADWRKAVPSYTQSSSTMDFRTWSSLPRDDSLEPLPLNWEMAYTETGMVYFIE